MSISESERPVRLRSFGTAKTGPIPISSGLQPATWKLRKMPRGRRPRALARSADITSVAEAPSESCEALPAVTVPPSFLNAGGSFASPSSVVSGRLHSSFETRTFSSVVSVPSLCLTLRLTVMGTMSLSHPSVWARAVRCWETSA